MTEGFLKISPVTRIQNARFNDSESESWVCGFEVVLHHIPVPVDSFMNISASRQLLHNKSKIPVCKLCTTMTHLGGTNVPEILSIGSKLQPERLYTCIPVNAKQIPE